MFSINQLKNTETKYFFWIYYLLIVVFGTLQIIYSPTELFLFVNSFVNNSATIVFKLITWIGSGYAYALICVALIIYNKWIGIATTSTFGLTSLVAQGIKNFIENIPRPLTYFQQQKIELLMPDSSEKLYWYSFPSGHTVSAFSMFCALAFVFKNKLISVLFILMALSVGVSRVYLTAHFVRDTYFGMIIGVELTCIVFYLFRFKLQKQ
ncbi:MAG: hypothetical protein RL065_891 [Bacteroidota bacterium]|jgi:membrane-associated phospholipid phosphatase